MFLPFYHGTSEEVRKKEQGIAFRRDFFFETTGPETWKPTMHEGTYGGYRSKQHRSSF